MWIAKNAAGIVVETAPTVEGLIALLNAVRPAEDQVAKVPTTRRLVAPSGEVFVWSEWDRAAARNGRP